MKYKYFYDQYFFKLFSTLEKSRHYLLDNISHKFINHLMRDGKRLFAASLLLKSLFILKKLTLISPTHLLKRAIVNSKSFFKIRLVKRGTFSNRHIKFLNSSGQFRSGAQHIISLASTLKYNTSFSFSHRLAVSILNCYFKTNSVMRPIYAMNSQIRDNHLKLPTLFSRNLSDVRFRRTRKTKGFYYMNKYGLYKKLTPLH
ncbi:MAG: hypothetical protein KJZ55_07745 [Flavobacteriales bacterium]|nr:hypothetical protein [Flavobacteriales bacterium]